MRRKLKHILCSITGFLISCRLWDNVERNCRAGQAHRWQYGACALHADTEGYTHTHTHSEYVIIIAFPLQQWLHERTSVLQVHCLSCWRFRAVTHFHLPDRKYSVKSLKTKINVHMYKDAFRTHREHSALPLERPVCEWRIRKFLC
jgi:hypothetical protein